MWRRFCVFAEFGLDKRNQSNPHSPCTWPAIQTRTRPLHPCRVAKFTVGAVLALSLMHAAPANAEAFIVIDAESGKVLQSENATYPWYPASVTKLMTAYTTLRAVKEGRITLNTPFVVSPN